MSLFGSGCEATKSQHFGVVVFSSCEFPKVATSHQGLATRSGLENGVMSCTVEKPNTNETFSLHHLQISFGGIPNIRNVLFLQIFLKRSQALQIPQLGLHPSLPDLLRNLLRNPVEPDLALHQSLPDLHLFRNPVEPDLALHCTIVPDLLRKSPCTPNLLRNILRNPEPDLALHQSLPKASQTFTGTFAGT